MKQNIKPIRHISLLIFVLNLVSMMTIFYDFHHEYFTGCEFLYHFMFSLLIAYFSIGITKRA